MNKTSYPAGTSFINLVINSVPALFAAAAFAVCFGIFFIFFPTNNTPIPREEAVAYSGTLEEYESLRNSSTLYFEDGTWCSIFPHTESAEFRQMMSSLEKGTKLYILVNPNNEYVVEIKTDDEELLNFETSQQAIDEYDNGYVIVGGIICAAGVFLFIYGLALAAYRRNEKKRLAEMAAKAENNGGTSEMLRFADNSVKNKILAETTAGGYTICYRRVKSVNELIINGRVYDEWKAVIELPHKLCASVDGHSFEAGLDNNSFSYIMFDGEVVESKRRIY